ncbi:universal stress protein [Acinetobacter sp. S40]|uniref:universal stress protein n=1 Tax=unclassified Acinetobacter TaxID=196816 RepID=UPI00190A6B15|nr:MULTISPECIES: universal stress protein [unclassified Acinetobacter]MBJ9985400.1 universal stress protein [Acinetobacter sp. S40]MBK0063750.1 universal stress protein [Acinetobacter sp. S55]MBK0066961.1 universal stress protein [Acinetobacter sp. S54]
MSYPHILIAIDDSAPSVIALKQALKLAQDLNSKVTLVEVMQLDPITAEEYVKTGQSNEYIERARNYILESLATIKAEYASTLEISTQLLEGFSVADAINQAAQELHVDLIVMGSHGRTGIKKIVLGSVAQKVLNESSIPVLIVK